MKRSGRLSVLRPLALARAELLLTKKRYMGLLKLDLSDCDAVDRFLVGTHSDLNGIAQAAALGVSHGLVHYWRKKLTARGLLDPTQRAVGRPVTDAEVEVAARLYRRGYSKRAIAAMREISHHRVCWLLKRAGVTTATPREQPALGARAVSRLFGLDPDRVVMWRWVQYGWLPDYRVVTRPGSSYRWDWDDVIALIRNRDSWPGWAPTQITDPGLRALAERERRAAGGAWHEQSEIAALLGLNASSLRRWEADYRLWSGLPRRPWGGATLVWLTDQQQADLAGRALIPSAPGSFEHRRRATALKTYLIAAYGVHQQVTAAD